MRSINISAWETDAFVAVVIEFIRAHQLCTELACYIKRESKHALFAFLPGFACLTIVKGAFEANARSVGLIIRVISVNALIALIP